MKKNGSNKLFNSWSTTLLLLSIASVLISCQARDYTKVKTEHFVVYLYNGIPKEAAQEMTSFLGEHYENILDSFLVESMDRVEIHLWTSHEDFLDKQMEIFNLTQPRAGGFAHGHGLYMMHGGSLSNDIALHEFVHVVSEWVNPDFRDNPRWLWEAIAVYLSNFPPVDPTLMSMITEQTYPSLDSLNADFDESTMIYTVGYPLGEFIMEEWNREVLRELIISGGDVPGVLDMTEEEFSLAWVEFIAENY